MTARRTLSPRSTKALSFSGASHVPANRLSGLSRLVLHRASTPAFLRGRFDLRWALADAVAVSLGEQSAQLVLGRFHAQTAGQFPGGFPMFTSTAQPQFAGGVARHVLER